MDAKKALYRAKLKEAAQKRDKRIDSPLVRYNEYDQPICRICDVVLKSESLWPAHQASRKHHEAITKFKANAAGQAQTNAKAEPRTEVVTKARSSSMLPTDFFDKRETKTQKTGLGTGNDLHTDTLKSSVKSLDSDSSEKILGKRKECSVTTNESVASESLVNEPSDGNTLNAKGRKELIHTTQKSSNFGAKGALPAGFFDSEATEKMGGSETKQLKGTLPDGFFDNNVVGTITKMDDSKLMQVNGSHKEDDYTIKKHGNSEVKQVKSALPEGFFDNKDADLRARGIQPVKTDIKDEYKEFEKLIQEDLHEVDERYGEEEIDAAEVREEEETLEQKAYRERVETLKKKCLEIKAAKSSEQRKSAMDEDSTDEDSSSDDEDDKENTTVDWRAMHL